MLLRIYLVALLLIPIVLEIIPVSFFDHGPSSCLSVLFFDRSCYGCGITRSVQHLIHFDLSAALAYNKLSLIVLPVLIIIWFKEVKRTLAALRLKAVDQKAREIENTKNEM